MSEANEVSEREETKIAPGQANASRVRGIFSKIAGKYDLFNTLSSLGFDKHWRRVLVNTCDLDSGDIVLDLASGTGDVAFALAKSGKAQTIYATDFVPEMLAVGEDKYAKLDLVTEVKFDVVDAQEIPFEDEMFDVATISFGIRNVPDKPKALKEAFRVLKPGGRFVVLEFSRPPFAPWRALYYIYLRIVIPFLGGLLTGDRDGFVYLNDSIHLFPDQKTFKSMLLEAGFSSVEYTNLTGGIVAIHAATK